MADRTSTLSFYPDPLVIRDDTNRLNVLITRQSTSYTNIITLDIEDYLVRQTALDSCYFDVPYSVIEQIPEDATGVKGALVVKTYSSGTEIGSAVYALPVHIDTTIECPSITSFTVADINQRTAAYAPTTGSMFRYASTLRVMVSVRPQGSYTQLTKAVIRCGSRVQEYTLNPLVQSPQNLTFTVEDVASNSVTVTVTDKRGTTITQTKTWTLIPYNPPSVAITQLARVTETGNTVNFTLTGGVYGGRWKNNVQNKLTIRYKYKESSSSTWLDGAQTFTYTPSTLGYDQYTFSDTISGFDYTKQYDIYFYVDDLLKTANSTQRTLPTGIPVYGNGENFFAVYGDLFLHERTNPANYVNVGTELAKINALTVRMLSNTYNSNESSDWNSTRYNQYKISGNGFVIISVNAYTDTNASYGNLRAYIQTSTDNGPTWEYEGWASYRHDANQSSVIDGLSLTIPLAVTDGELIRAVWQITKEDRKICRVKMLGIGVTAEQTVNGGTL